MSIKNWFKENFGSVGFFATNEEVVVSGNYKSAPGAEGVDMRILDAADVTVDGNWNNMTAVTGGKSKKSQETSDRHTRVNRRTKIEPNTMIDRKKENIGREIE